MFSSSAKLGKNCMHLVVIHDVLIKQKPLYYNEASKK